MATFPTISPTSLNGTQIGPYRVIEQIGSGGMGAVYLAEHVALGRRAAIKVIHAALSHHTEIVTRFFNEARAATAIHDPGIVQIFDFGHHTDGSAYIVMELLDGETLDRRLDRGGPLPVARALRIMRQVASSLGAAHEREIVHRDLKPENIVMVRDPEVAGGERPKIVDFGIAKLVGGAVGVKTHTSAVMGTPMYMSPEQCRGAGHVDQRSDVYSLGCVLFALLTGRPPFQAEGVGEIIAMHLRELADPPSKLRADVPPPVDALVARCLAKDPAERFASGADLAFALARLLASEPEIGVTRASSRAPVAPRPLPPLSATSSERDVGALSRSAMAGVLAGAVVGIGIVVFAIRPLTQSATPVVVTASDVSVAQMPATNTNTTFVTAPKGLSQWSSTAAVLDDAREPLQLTWSGQSGGPVGLIFDDFDGSSNTQLLVTSESALFQPAPAAKSR